MCFVLCSLQILAHAAIVTLILSAVLLTWWAHHRTKQLYTPRCWAGANGWGGQQGPVLGATLGSHRPQRAQWAGVGLGNLRGLFQPSQFCDSLISHPPGDPHLTMSLLSSCCPKEVTADLSHARVSWQNLEMQVISIMTWAVNAEGWDRESCEMQHPTATAPSPCAALPCWSQAVCCVLCTALCREAVFGQPESFLLIRVTVGCSVLEHREEITELDSVQLAQRSWELCIWVHTVSS